MHVAWLEEVFDQKTQPWYREEYVSPDEFAPDLERHLARRRGAAAPATVTPLDAPLRRA